MPYMTHGERNNAAIRIQADYHAGVRARRNGDCGTAARSLGKVLNHCRQNGMAQIGHRAANHLFELEYSRARFASAGSAADLSFHFANALGDVDGVNVARCQKALIAQAMGQIDRQFSITDQIESSPHIDDDNELAMRLETAHPFFTVRVNQLESEIAYNLRSGQIPMLMVTLPRKVQAQVQFEEDCGRFEKRSQFITLQSRIQVLRWKAGFADGLALAFKLSDDAVEYAEIDSMPDQRSCAMLHRAKLHASHGDADVAERDGRDVLEHAQAGQFKLYEIDARVALAEVLARSHHTGYHPSRFAEAQSHTRHAMEQIRQTGYLTPIALVKQLAGQLSVRQWDWSGVEQLGTKDLADEQVSAPVTASAKPPRPRPVLISSSSSEPTVNQQSQAS